MNRSGSRSPARRNAPAGLLAGLMLAVSALAGTVLTAPGAAALPPGTLDTTFGTTGLVQLADPAPTGVARLVTDGNGRLLLLTTGTAPAVTRLTATGVADPAFGTAGRAAIGTAATAGWLGLASAPARTLVYGGGTGRLVVRRLLGSGAADTAFGTAGTATLTVPVAPTAATRSGIAATADGGAFVWWQTTTVPVSSVLARVTATGTLDPAFGAGTPTPGLVTLAGAAVTGVVADGVTPVIALQTAPGAASELRRLTAAGALDATFAPASPGRLALPAGFGSTGGVTLTATGGYLVGGFQLSGLAGLGHLSAAVVTTAGDLDPAFGTAGVTVAQSWTCTGSTQPLATAAAVHLVGGACSGSAAVDLVRLSAAGVPDARFGTGGHAALSDVGDIFVDAPAGAGISAGQPVVAVRGALSTNARVVGLVRLRSSTGVVPGGFLPLSPKRLLDTRTGAPVPAGGTVRFRVDTGLPGSGVPAGQAAAAVLTLTAIGGTAAGGLAVFPAGAAAPAGNQVSFATGQSIANQVTTRLGTGGVVVVRNGSTGTVHVVADVTGYYRVGTATAPGTFAPLAPGRVLDTLTGVGGPVGPVAAVSTRAVTVAGAGGVPATGAAAVVLNLTVSRPTVAGSVAVFPAGIATPITSGASFTAGQTVSTQVTTRIGTSGRVTLLNRTAGTLHAVIDVMGYYRSGTATAPGAFVPIDPVRLVNTAQAGGGGALGPGAARFVSTASTTRIPATRVAGAAFTVTALAPTANGGLVVLPGDQPVFETANLSFSTGRAVAGQVVSGTGYSGIWLVNSGTGSVQAAVDVFGWFRS